MHVNVGGIVDPETGKEIWIDVSEFNGTKEVRGRQQDYVGWIINATLSELGAREKVSFPCGTLWNRSLVSWKRSLLTHGIPQVMRYWVRCSTLYSKLAAGTDSRKVSLQPLPIANVLRL